uniref:Uncharacterized protein n=1 Tax=Rhizophora mucronata TaxID=61149 RepID=A0A2P2PTN0_RHIMU
MELSWILLVKTQGHDCFFSFVFLV